MYVCNIHYIGGTLKTDVNIPNITYYDLLTVCLYSVYVSYHIIIQTFISFLKCQLQYYSSITSTVNNYSLIVIQ